MRVIAPGEGAMHELAGVVVAPLRCQPGPPGSSGEPGGCLNQYWTPRWGCLNGPGWAGADIGGGATDVGLPG